VRTQAHQQASNQAQPSISGR